MTRIAIVYYSSTGHTWQIAQAMEEGARSAGAETRLCRARELAGEQALAARPEWQAHLDATRDVPEATPDDLAWADGFALGSPTRFGLPAAQLKQYIDTLGPQWTAGQLQDKAACAFTGAGNAHGGQESTLLALQNVFYHWGSIIVPVGFTSPLVKAAGGNPYGLSFTAAGGQVPKEKLSLARYQGQRLARAAQAVAVLRG